MKKIILVAVAVMLTATIYGQSTTVVVSDSVFQAKLAQIQKADQELRTTSPKTYESGRRGVKLSAGAIYGPEINASLVAAYQFGKNGGMEIGVQAEAGNRIAVEVFVKQNLGLYHAESRLIPALKLGAGASERDMWCGRTTDQTSKDFVWLGIASKRMAFSASAEFDLTWKPINKEQRFYIEGFAGYRLTPKQGREMTEGNTFSDGTNVYPIASRLEEKAGHFFGGIRIGWDLYRLK